MSLETNFAQERQDSYVTYLRIEAGGPRRVRDGSGRLEVVIVVSSHDDWDCSTDHTMTTTEARCFAAQILELCAAEEERLKDVVAAAQREYDAAMDRLRERVQQREAGGQP